MNKQPVRSRHPILFPVLAIGIGLFMGLLVAEGVARVLEYRAAAHKPQQPAAGSLPQTLVTTLRPATRYGYQPTPWYARFAGRAVNLHSLLVPFSSIDCDTQSMGDPPPRCRDGYQNSHGYRVPEYTLAHPPDTFRIVIVGDSFTWGDGVRMEETYHRRLQERFDRARVPDAPQVEVIGLGVNAATAVDNIIRLFVYGQRLDPDLVLVQFTDNDLEYQSNPHLLAPERVRDPVDAVLVTTAVGRILRKLRPRDTGTLRDPFNLQRERNITRTDLNGRCLQAR